MTWLVGDYWWLGDTCLECTEVTVDGSHRTREVARATADRLFPSRWTVWEWPCPECGRRCTHTGKAIPVRMVPLCTDCIVGVISRALSPEARDELDAGLRSAGEKPAVDLGSFAEYADDDCPPTLRDPGLPPAARDGCASAAGAPDSRE